MKCHGEGFFYGWWIVIVTFIIMLIGTGINIHSFTVFIKPLEADFGWTRTAISSAIGVWGLAFCLASPVGGYLIKKWGTRKIIVISGLVNGISNILYGSMTAYSHLCVLMAANAVATVGLTWIPCQVLILNWFEKKRGLAMGIMMTGLSVGGLIAVPMSNYLINAYGWRRAFVVLGLICLSIVPLALAFIRTKPANMGLQPYGALSAEHEDGGGTIGNAEKIGLSVKRALTTYLFWMALLVTLLVVFAKMAFEVHFVPLASDSGVPSQMAANCWGLAIGISAIGGLLFGFLADRMEPHRLLASAFAARFVAVGILFIFLVHFGIIARSVLLPFAVLYGVGFGGGGVAWPIFMGRCFGPANFSQLQGLIQAGSLLSLITGPIFSGVLYDTMGDYQIVLICVIALFGATTVLISFVNPDRYKNEFQILS